MLFVAIWLALIVACYMIAARRGHPIVGLLVGIVMPLFLPLLFFYDERDDCPACKRSLELEATACAYCGWRRGTFHGQPIAGPDDWMHQVASSRPRVKAQPAYDDELPPGL